MKNTFYFATVGTNIEISPDKVSDCKTDFKNCSDPISYGIWWAWNKYGVFPSVTLFCTDGTSGSIPNFNKVKDKFDDKIANGKINRFPIEAHNLQLNLDKLHNYFKERINDIVRNASDYFIVINPTSGTTPMTISLFQSIIDQLGMVDLYHINIIYIQEFKTQRLEGKGKFEDMQVNELSVKNIAGITLLNKAVEQIAEQNFSTAFDMLEKTESDDPSFKEIIRCFRILSEGLSLWDDFNHENALRKLKEFNKSIIRVRHYLTPLQDTFVIWNQDKITLSEKLDFKKLSIFHIADMLTNLERRLNRKEYADALIRLQRSIELFFELLLSEHNFDVQKPNFDGFSEEQKLKINERYKGVLEKMYINGEELSMVYDFFKNRRIYLKEMATLLEFYGNPRFTAFGKIISIKAVLNIVHLRNESYLTHNIRSNVFRKEKEIRVMHDKFKDLISNYYGNNCFEVSNLNVKNILLRRKSLPAPSRGEDAEAS